MALFGAAGEQSLTIVIRARNEAEAVLRRVETQTKQFAATNREMLRDARLAGAAATAAIGALGFAAIKAAASMEQTKIAFETMLGSAADADRFIRDLTQFARTTPFTLAGLETASKQLLAYGFAQEEVLPNLRALGDIAAGVGMDKLPNLILAFGQVKAATRLTGMELRQFTEAGVPLLEELSRIMQKPVSAIQDMVSAGEVGFPIVQQAIQNLTTEGGRFNNLMAKQAQSLGGMWSNLGDSWDVFLRNEGARMLDFAKAFVQSAEGILTRVSDWSHSNQMLSGTLFMVSGAAAALLTVASSLALVLPKIVGFLRLGVAAILRMNPAVLALSAALGVVLAKLAQFGESVGGMGRAWELTVMQMAINFEKAMNKLPFVDRTKEIKQLESEFFALANSSIQPTTVATDDLSDATQAAAESYQLLDGAAQNAADKIKDTQQAIRGAHTELERFQNALLGDDQAAARAFVEQEQKVAALQSRLEEERGSGSFDHSRVVALQAELDHERRALEGARGLEAQLPSQVANARRRASLTDFERTIEDIEARRVERVQQDLPQVILNVNFNDAVAGDDGIQKIMMETIQLLNRRTALVSGGI